MEKTRKERLSAEKNKKSFDQSRNSNELIKKGTAVFSTTLLVSLLAFPAFSASASANEAAETSSKKLEETLEQNDNVIEKEGTKVAIETTNDTYITEDDLIEKDQKISELKKSMTIEMFETLEIDKLSMAEIDELLLTALEKMTEEKNNTTEKEIDATDEVVTEPEAIVAEPEAEVVEEKIETPTKAIKVVEPKVIDESTKIENDSSTEGTENNDQVAETIEADEVEVPSVVEINVPEEVLEEKTEEPTKAIEVAEPELEETVETVVEVEEPKVEKEVVQEKTVAPTTKAKTVAPTKAVTASTPKAAAITTTATPKVAAKTAVASAKTYTVKSGDTLNKISKANGVTVTELKKWNNLSSDLIQVGQVLALNETAAKTTPVTTPGKTNEAIAGAKTPAGFVNAIASYAQQVAAKNNLYASVMIAQAALESGYGGSKLSSSPNHNLFGIKGSYNGNTVTMYTSEWSASTGWIYIPQNFKKYPSYAESLQDNANLIQNGTSWDNGYYSGAWVSNSDSAFEATAWLQGRYATDPTYASKLNAIINSYNLTQYDTKSSGVPTQNTPESNDNTTVPTPTPNTGNTTSTSYTVKSGDTLTGISSKYGVSVSDLKSWNSLKSDTIYVNQALTIKGGTTIPAPIPSTGNTTSTSYTVKSGDTLTGISSKYGVSVSDLKSWNSLKSDTIYVNQALTIKGGTTTPAPSPSTGNTTSASYTVRSGDTLTGISSKYGVSVSDLKSWNSLKSDTIYVNQALTIKGGTTTPAPSPSTGNTTSTSYTVKSGDTLTGISSKYGVSVSELKSWNNLKTDAIFVNQALTIKGGTTTPAPSPSTGNTTSTSYTVKSGDTLTGISSKYGVSVSELKSWNNLKTDAIFVNQALTIKGGTTTPIPSPSTGNTTSTSYTVKSGDTLTGISSKYGVSVSELKSWNNLKTDAIFVNQALTIKGGAVSGGTTTPVPSKTTTTCTSYTVKSGDTLSGIGSKYGVSVSELKSWNNLKTDAIFVNQALTIKGGAVSGGTTTPAPSKTTTSSTSYTVKSGDTLSGIGSKYAMSVAELKTANKLTSDTIYVGQKLVVKSTTTGSTTVVTAPTSSKTHKIVSGDSLWSIAQQYGISVSELKAANYLKSDVIFVGQSLIIK